MTTRDFEIRSGDLGGARVVAILGELDLSTKGELAEALAGIPPLEPLIVDLTECDYVDSAGLYVLAEARRARDGSGIALVATGNLARVLGMVDFDRLFGVFSSRDDAHEQLLRTTGDAA